MKEDSKIRQELATYVRDLPAEKVKTAVIEWLSMEEGNIADLEQNLSLELERDESAIIYGAIDINLFFIPLTEEEMIAQSIDALDEYQLDGRSVSQQKMEQWAASLGTDDELPCPR